MAIEIYGLLCNLCASGYENLGWLGTGVFPNELKILDGEVSRS
jgi:hypothetical protein